MALTVTVKWGKEKFPGVILDTSDDPSVFKAQLFALTGVPVDRMKIMGLGGKQLKDGTVWSDYKLKDGQNVMLMGTAEVLAEAPKEKVQFLEDMPADKAQSAQSNLPAGLTNVGNTCYMNSGLQLLRNIPDLRNALTKYMGTDSGHIPESQLVINMRDLFKQLDQNNGLEIPPLQFLQTFQRIFPQFAQKGPRGEPLQQDAEECWSCMLSGISQRLSYTTDSAPTDLDRDRRDGENGVLTKSIGDMLFGLQVESRLKCVESDEEEPLTREVLRKLPCHINIDTAHLFAGIEEGLTETVTKMSPTLGREAEYQKTSKFSRLPPYLAVQFVRFYWRRDTNERAKILKQIPFPKQLDLWNLCNPELKKKIEIFRDKEEQQKEKALKKEAKAASPEAAAKAAKEEKDFPSFASEAASSEVAVAAPAAEAMDTVEDNEAMDTTPLEEDEAMKVSNTTGRYELFGIITHQGRTAEGGHYVAWLKKSETEWLVYDDETVVPVKEDHIQRLQGGGDYHMAYICLYRKS